MLMLRRLPDKKDFLSLRDGVDEAVIVRPSGNVGGFGQNRLEFLDAAFRDVSAGTEQEQ